MWVRMVTYKIKSMAEINAIPWNGYKVVSTFSGGGGSCLGYRLAGYKVLWANEFVEEAQKTYRANHPTTFLNCKNIREVTAEEVLQESGLKVGEIDLFDGSPPCSGFSMAGIRERGWGKAKKYSDNKKERVDDLFFEYTRLIRGLKPKVFVAENVKGLVQGKAKGYFKLILQEMIDCGYVVKAKLLDASWLGVPQRRQRVIFMGVRKDLAEKYNVVPTFPTPLDYTITLGEALNGVKNDDAELEVLRAQAEKYAWGKVLKRIKKNPKRPLQGTKFMGGSYFNLVRESLYKPCSTVCQLNGNRSASGNCHPLEDRKFTIAELKRITSVPDDFVLTGNYERQWERLGRMVPPMMMYYVAKTIETQILRKIC